MGFNIQVRRLLMKTPDPRPPGCLQNLAPSCPTKPEEQVVSKKCSTNCSGKTQLHRLLHSLGTVAFGLASLAIKVADRDLEALPGPQKYVE